MAETEIEAAYIRRNPKSAAHAERARRVCPGGVSQHFREIAPFPPCYERAEGTRKWTLDGQEIVDYCMGHGALIFGHRYPEVERAAQAQLVRGTHFGSITPPEAELAELVCELIPCAEGVRFTATGSEAVMLAIRIARSATGRDKIVKFEGHYHGWHDHTLVGLKPPYDRPITGGAVGAREHVLVLPPNDVEAVARTLTERKDVACIVVEPAGGSHGTVPTAIEWVRALRDLSRAHDVPLIFDEMVSGFRLAPGGYQEAAGIEPDLTTLGKALFGGFPGGAVVGRRDLMDLTKSGADKFVAHWGTWNAFPVACAAGVATLKELRHGTAQSAINEFGRRVRASLNEVIREMKVGARVYGSGSHIHFLLRPWPFDDGIEVPPAGRHAELAAAPDQQRLFRLAMLVNGVDVDHGNNISVAHGDAEADRLRDAFAETLRMMLADGLVSPA